MLELTVFAYAIGNPLFRYMLASKYSVLFGVLITYHCLNYIFNGAITFNREYVQTFRPLVENYIILNLSCYLFLKNTSKALKYIFVGYFVYVLLTFNIVSIDASFENRLTGLIHSNQFAQCAGMGLLLLAYMKYYTRLSYLTVFLLSLLFIAAIVGSGSRNGFLLFVFFSLMLLVGSIFRGNMKIQNYILTVFVFASLYLCTTYILTETGLGERVLSTEEWAKHYRVGTNTYFDKLGDRGFYYIRGWANFLDHSLFGIGMWNFAPYNHYKYPLHSELMIHLCEGGIVGILIYSSFLFLFVKRLVINFFRDKNEHTVLPVLIFTAYIAVGISAREFYYVMFYPLLGLCLYSILKQKLYERIYLSEFFSRWVRCKGHRDDVVRPEPPTDDNIIQTSFKNRI